ncbi:NADPH-dependent FMN reductase [Celeribacter neptunius]|uniref:NAD(P)H-dependent FMN reductase n=1 Tax=Celeribacter neptunius TaxID=588602 RepID=A0A1I3K7K0_9RHOB|nr:NAD(P)H-dependent oxidoreductase [Celeribacter neptunius]SFI68165.1 NAD(P)H-dependent FMN reductase [Celeribacter neptunius]
MSKIAVLVGSLRAGSLTRKLAERLTELAPDGMEFSFVEIGDLPFFNEDLDTDTPPAAWTRLREAIKAADGVLFVTPEYNRSVPAAIKNALDVGSRPYGASAWAGKPAGIVTASPSGIGGFGANHHLRQPLVFLNMPTMQQPEAYIGNLWGMFDEDGKIVTEGTEDFLKSWMAAYAKWVADHI